MGSEKSSATSEFNRERIGDEFAPRCQVPNGSHLQLSLSSPAFAISPSESESKVRANDSENMPTSSPNMSSQKCDHTDAAETTQPTENSRIFFA